MKVLIAAAVLGLTANVASATLSLNSLLIELPPGWVHEVKEVHTDPAFGNRISVRHPDGVGVLHFQTYRAPAPVSEEALRLLTNVPEVELIAKRQWGEFSGYDYEYVEHDVFYRTWWLARDENVVFITYRCGADQQDVEIGQVEIMVQSLRSTLR